MVLVTLVVAFHSPSFAQPDSRGFLVQVGQPVPSFSLTDLDGQQHTNESLLGTTYVLQFTASWCSVCRAEMPHLESEVWQAFADRESPFLLLGVDLDEPEDKVRTFADQMGVTYPMCSDDGGDLFYRVAARKAGVTRNVVVNNEGTIVMLTRLFEEDEFQRMVTLVDELTSPFKD